MSKLTWQQRRYISNILYKGLYNDVNLQIVYHDNQTDQQLIDQVLDFFRNGSTLDYPAKYIFCNIVYSYFLNKYFQLDFYTMLSDKDTLPNSPIYCTYKDRKNVYDQVLIEVLPNIEQYHSIDKTRKYFKQEFLIHDEDLSEVDVYSKNYYGTC